LYNTAVTALFFLFAGTLTYSEQDYDIICGYFSFRKLWLRSHFRYLEMGSAHNEEGLTKIPPKTLKELERKTGSN
jgi:hypothetical protein